MFVSSYNFFILLFGHIYGSESKKNCGKKNNNKTQVQKMPVQQPLSSMENGHQDTKKINDPEEECPKLSSPSALNCSEKKSSLKLDEIPQSVRPKTTNFKKKSKKNKNSKSKSEDDLEDFSGCVSQTSENPLNVAKESTSNNEEKKEPSMKNNIDSKTEIPGNPLLLPVSSAGSHLNCLLQAINHWGSVASFFKKTKFGPSSPTCLELSKILSFMDIYRSFISKPCPTQYTNKFKCLWEIRAQQLFKALKKKLNSNDELGFEELFMALFEKLGREFLNSEDDLPENPLHTRIHSGKRCHGCGKISLNGSIHDHMVVIFVHRYQFSVESIQMKFLDIIAEETSDFLEKCCDQQKFDDKEERFLEAGNCTFIIKILTAPGSKDIPNEHLGPGIPIKFQIESQKRQFICELRACVTYLGGNPLLILKEETEWVLIGDSVERSIDPKNYLDKSGKSLLFYEHKETALSTDS